MQVEAQRLRNRTDDIKEIESGHGHRIDWAKIGILSINSHEFATIFSKIIHEHLCKTNRKLWIKAENICLNCIIFYFCRIIITE
jgi:hypothetical protein